MMYTVYQNIEKDPEALREWLNKETRYSGLRLVAVSGDLYFFVQD